jgi:hypothetical protein
LINWWIIKKAIVKSIAQPEFFSPVGSILGKNGIDTDTRTRKIILFITNERRQLKIFL